MSEINEYYDWLWSLTDKQLAEEYMRIDKSNDIVGEYEHFEVLQSVIMDKFLMKNIPGYAPF